eukprot:SAG31_NODE_1157_length_9612_cov_6.630401_1_plen_70_part_00
MVPVGARSGELISCEGLGMQRSLHGDGRARARAMRIHGRARDSHTHACLHVCMAARAMRMHGRSLDLES